MLTLLTVIIYLLFVFFFIVVCFRKPPLPVLLREWCFLLFVLFLFCVLSAMFPTQEDYIPSFPINNLTTKATAISHVTSFIEHYCRIHKIQMCQVIINLCIKIYHDKNAVSYRQTLKYLFTPGYVIDVYDFQCRLWKPAVYIHHLQKKQKIIVRFIPVDNFTDSSFETIDGFPVNYIKKNFKTTFLHYHLVSSLSNLPAHVKSGQCDVDSFIL